MDHTSAGVIEVCQSEIPPLHQVGFMMPEREASLLYSPYCFKTRVGDVVPVGLAGGHSMFYPYTGSKPNSTTPPTIRDHRDEIASIYR